MRRREKGTPGGYSVPANKSCTQFTHIFRVVTGVTTLKLEVNYKIIEYFEINISIIREMVNSNFREKSEKILNFWIM